MENFYNSVTLKEVWLLDDVIRPTSGGLKKGLVIKMENSGREEWVLIRSKRREEDKYELEFPKQVFLNQNIFDTKCRKEALDKAGEMLDEEIFLHEEIARSLRGKQIRNLLKEALKEVESGAYIDELFPTKESE